MTVLIEHPEGWIGVPEHFPNDTWRRAKHWAADLLDEISTDWPAPTPEQRKARIKHLVVIAGSRRARGASRTYLRIDDWTSPLGIADMILARAPDDLDMTLEQLLGSEDPDALQPPAIEEFTTRSGLTGIRGSRYIRQPGTDSVLARMDYVWQLPGAYMRLYTADTDLVDFERMLPLLEDLAATVSVTD